MTDLPNPEDPPSSTKRSRGFFGLGRRNKKAEDAIPPVAEPPRQSAMRLRLAEFEEGRVADVMIPRADIIAVEADTPFEDLIKLFAEATHSRLPVYRDTLDNPIGFVHIKDVVGEIARDGDTGERPLERLARNALIVPDSMPLSTLLVKMQATRIHLAIVVDEYGGTDGLVSLEDIVEMVVGDIEDEHDDEEEVIQQIGTSGDRYLIDAKADLDGLREQLGNDFVDAAISREDEVDTIGGLIFSLLGRVPVRGEVVPPFGGFDIEVTDADPRRIKRVRLSRVKHGVRRAHVQKREPVASEKAD